MAAGEDQAEAIVLNLLLIHFLAIKARFVDARLDVGSQVSLSTPSKRARLRIPSMALKRAVEISQGRGLSGIPV
jgi:hypothetical protein